MLFHLRFVQVNVRRLTLVADFRFFRDVSVTGPSSHSVLWNAMIHPLQNMTLKGAVWYQGELTLSPLCQLAFAV